MNQDQIYNLVEAAKHGDDNAFAQLYEASYRMVYHVSLGYLKNNEDAEDITQEVFIKAYNSLHSLNDNLTFFGWVQTMASNRCKNKLRDRKEFISFEAESDIENELSGDDNLEFLPDTYVMKEEQRNILNNIMRNELSDVQYQTIYIHYYNNLTVEQISAIMGVPTGTVKTRLKNSRIKIKEGVERYERVNNDKISAYGAIPAIGLVINQTINNTPMNFIPFSKGAIASTAGATIGASTGTTAATVTTATTATGASTVVASTSILTKVLISAVAVTTIGAGTVAVVKYNKDSHATEQAIVETAVVDTENSIKVEIDNPTIETSVTISIDETVSSGAQSFELILSNELNSIVLSLQSDAAYLNFDSISTNHPEVMKYLKDNTFAFSSPGDYISIVASDYNNDGTNELFICGLNKKQDDCELLEMYSMTSDGPVLVCPTNVDYPIAYYYFNGVGVVSQDDSSIVDVLKLSDDGTSLVLDHSYSSFDELNTTDHTIPGRTVLLKDY